MTMPWTAAQLTKALVEQHNFVWDVAYCAAYYYVHGCAAPTPWAVALSHIQKVKNIPAITRQAAELMLDTYRNANPTECKRIFVQRRDNDNL